MRQISDKTTEQQNVASKDIDQMSTREVLVTMNREDQKVPLAVEKAIPEIEQFIDKVVASMKKGGRLFYVGAGTSGRLGVLDASEIPPTFSAPNTLVQGIMCGGLSALVTAVEGAEDDFDAGYAVVDERGLTKNDCLLGITTSGLADYVHAALKRAKEIGATTGLLVCNHFESKPYIDIIIKAVVGPEIVTGSTRLKSGTATKLILNMITTTAMIKLNKTYGNLMVDLMTTNKKLWDRGARIIRHCTDVDYDTGMATLKKANGSVKTALVMV
ncbi:MAG: N-acetylmuramic acid 6-phosphate etherase, partial [Candidatus Marinimicrobia bacterium]|nr:N-acetylmuramic acid 6-phosphate etherase [Candidatus Neomarinimicrobiota bacterium]